MSWAIWITGPPASDKSTIAGMVKERPAGDDVSARVLELGAVLGFAAGGGSYTPLADVVAHRTLVYAAKVLNEAGVPVIVDDEPWTRTLGG